MKILTIENEFASILGPSGSGKTTLLNIIGGLDQYTSGNLVINGVSTKDYKDRDFSWCDNIIRRIENGYELELYIKRTDKTYCKINYKKFLFVNGVFTFIW